MTSEQLIAQARELRADFDADVSPSDVTRAALDEIYGHGVADEQSGDVESPPGFFYRVDRWVVVVDEQGFVRVDEHANATYAREHFNALDREFARWQDA